MVCIGTQSPYDLSGYLYALSLFHMTIIRPVKEPDSEMILPHIFRKVYVASQNIFGTCY